MKIYAGPRLEKVLRDKAEYEEQYQKEMEVYEGQRQQYSQAQKKETDAVKESIEAGLTKFDLLQFDIRVQESLFYEDTSGLEVYIQCNEHNKFEDTVALAWSYQAELNRDGTLRNETGSWSGLKAITPAQMNSLRQTVEALEYLNSIDWPTLLKREMPTWADYITVPRPKTKHFRDEELAAAVEDSIGQRILFKCRSKNAYYKFIKVNDKTYEVKSYSAYDIKNQADLERVVENWGVQKRIKKSEIAYEIAYPLETVEY